MGLSLNDLAEKIYSSRTTEYFQEVLTSYQIGNYRSAVVMLWSVVVYDLLHKLDHLDSRGNSQAQAILKWIEEEQRKNPRSSVWEGELLKKAQESLKLITISEYENLSYLHGQRHLCAHPAIDNERKLHSPNKETVRSLIINTLQGLLTKPPFYSKEIFTEILVDIADNKKHFSNSYTKIKEYLDSKYINHLSMGVRETIFANLWKIVFKLDNEDCVKNRLINFHALIVFAESLNSGFSEVIAGDVTKYSDINVSDEIIKLYIVFLSKINFYSLVKLDLKIKIKAYIDKNIDGQLLSWFMEGEANLAQYILRLKTWMKNDERNNNTKEGIIWEYMFKKFDTQEWEKSFLPVMLLYWERSASYDDADIRFSEVIAPYIDRLDVNELEELVTIVNENSQIYGRRRAREDHVKIYNRIKEFSGEGKLIIDLDLYPNFQY